MAEAQDHQLRFMEMVSIFLMKVESFLVKNIVIRERLKWE
jgi:hypothetical protein